MTTTTEAANIAVSEDLAGLEQAHVKAEAARLAALGERDEWEAKRAAAQAKLDRLHAGEEPDAKPAAFGAAGDALAKLESQRGYFTTRLASATQAAREALGALIAARITAELNGQRERLAGSGEATVANLADAFRVEAEAAAGYNQTIRETVATVATNGHDELADTGQAGRVFTAGTVTVSTGSNWTPVQIGGSTFAEVNIAERMAGALTQALAVAGFRASGSISLTYTPPPTADEIAAEEARRIAAAEADEQLRADRAAFDLAAEQHRKRLEAADLPPGDAGRLSA